MLPYILLISFILISLLLNKKRDNISFVIIAIYILFLGYFRAETVGTDILFSYKENFKYTTFNVSSWNARTLFEPGFNYLIAFWKKYISRDLMTFIGFTFVVFSIPFFIFIKKYSYRPNLTLLIFVLWGYFFTSMNIMRQFFCIGLIFIGLTYLLAKKKYLLYCFYTIICSALFHSSGFILLLLPFFDKFSITLTKRNKMILTSLLLFSYIAFFFKEFIMNTLSSLLYLISLVKFKSYTEGSDFYEGIGITALFQMIFCILFIWLSNNKKSNMYYLSYIAGCIIYNLLSCFSKTTGRVGINLILIGLIAITGTWYMHNSNKKRNMYRLALIVYSIVYFTYAIIIKNYNECVPYILRLNLQ